MTSGSETGSGPLVICVPSTRALRGAVHGFTTLEIAGSFGLPFDLDESFSCLIDTLIAGLGLSSQ